MNSKITLGARIVLGLIMLVFGLNKFLGFLPQPEMAEPAGALMGAFAETGYMFPLIAVVEIVTGALLLLGLFVPLALILLAPVSVNIVLFHLFLDPGGILLGLVVLVLNLLLMFAYIQSYKPLLRAK